MEYPDNLLKGIYNDSFLDDRDDSVVLGHLFYFKRGDVEWERQSINWQDDDEAINFTLSQEKGDGTLQFNAGLAKVPKDEIKRLGNSSSSSVKGKFTYERETSADNKYHGNLLLDKDVPDRIMKMLGSAIAMYATRIPQL